MPSGVPALIVFTERVGVARLNGDAVGDADEEDEDDEDDETEADPEATDRADAWISGAAATGPRTDDAAECLCAAAKAAADEVEEAEDDAEAVAEDDAAPVAECPVAVAGAGGRAPANGPEWGPRLDDMLILLAMPWQTWQRREKSPPQLETPGQVALPKGHMQLPPRFLHQAV